jgi:hypothetical protein
MTGRFITKNGKKIFIDDNRQSKPRRRSTQKTVSRPRPKLTKPTKPDIRTKLSESEIQEWEKTAGSEVIGVKNEMFEGMPVSTVMFQNGDEWFEFDSFVDQEDFFEKTFEKVSDIGKFIKVDHPKIEGYVNLISGKTLFERMGGKVGKEKK